MDARIPMITTTMSSSISVKPRRDRSTEEPSGRQRAPDSRAWPQTSGAAIVWHQGSLPQDLCLVFGIHPIASSSDTYDERHRQSGSLLHMAFYQTGGGLRFGHRDLKHQLVVHLQDHPAP